MSSPNEELKTGARLTLFLVSYMPLFLIMTVNQLYKKKDYLHWGGMHKEAFAVYVENFGAITVIILLVLFGVMGLVLLLSNMEERVENDGDLVKIIDIENKNSESISYLFTYLLPFLFQDLSDPISVFSLFILLLVTFLIYCNSSMILINPTLAIRYSLYNIVYTTGGKNEKKGMVICKSKYLDEDDYIKIQKIGHKLFYAKFQEQEE
ncbi:hypothetical protein DKP45_16235 [Salmonella enterica subsp. diarizonae]|nr:hypothetical protein [Salmonella enterica subsp. diarizonae]EBX8420720.1 hypothetical protein [Salmonella enterica subsp. enterica serovar Urbana]ECG0445224.1 hypothetical protein [Salmonella enterica]EHQ9197046.1 hypothetical protein [Salmonella enterica subsp. diarizonae serovar 50:k:z:[z50],[z57],[z68], [z86]]EKQ8933902.1 hypothetical protein [Salmonella enterica]